MRNYRKILLVGIVAVSALLLSCGGESPQSSNGNNSDVTVVSGEFTCPMECNEEKVYSESGYCPKCSMILQPTDAVKAE